MILTQDSHVCIWSVNFVTEATSLHFVCTDSMNVKLTFSHLFYIHQIKVQREYSHPMDHHRISILASEIKCAAVNVGCIQDVFRC